MKEEKEIKTYHFTGYATVSVETSVKAESEEDARNLIECGECEWVCEGIDGDVDDIEFCCDE